MKKTWIKVKRGILDPKHVRSVGPALWVFELMIDAADWETGIVRGWTDKQAAEDFGIKQSTVRDWRQRLVKYEYITCKQVGRALDIQIHNWTNPREYAGEVRSARSTKPADVGDAWGDVEGSVSTEPLADEGSVQGSVSGSVRAEGPFIESTIHIPHEASKDQTPWVQVLSILRRGMDRAEFDTWVQPTELLSLSGETLTIAAANSFGIERLEKRHRKEIEAAVREVIGRPVRVRFVVVQAVEA